MAKARKHAKSPSGNPDVVFYMSAEDVTRSRMPKYNGYACGTGAHGSRKYDRNKAKRNFRREMGW